MQLSFADARPRRGLVVTVLPDAARAEEWLSRAAGERGLAAGKIACTVSELEREIVREARRAGRCPAAAPPHAVELAVADAAREHTPPGSPLHLIRRQPGYARALTELWSALGQGLLEPGELLDLPLPEPVRERVAPLARVLAAARARLDRSRIAEPARALRLALEGEPQLPPWVREAAELRFDAVLDWTPLRLRLATALAKHLRVRVRLPFAAGRPELAEALDPTLRAFERLGEGPAPELELFDPESGPLTPFLANLFAGVPSNRRPPEETAVRLVSSATPSAQARDLARACADLLAGGAEPDGIAVAARSLGAGVAEELSAALSAAGVPWRERRGRPALAAAPVRLALSLLDLVERGIPREGLIELFSSRLLWLAEERERLPPHALAGILRAAHARDDLSEGGLLARLDAYALREQGREGSRTAVAEARARVARVLEELRTLPARGTVAEHGAALLTLLRRWGLDRHLRAALPDDGFGRAAAAAMGRDQAGARRLEETCLSLAQAARAVGLAGEVHSRVSFAQLLAEALAGAALPAGGARGGAVHLLELRELPGRTFEHVFVAGLVDGQLPAAATTDPFLSDEDRRAVNRAAGRAVFRAVEGSGEPGLVPQRQSEEPLLFHLALCAASRSLSLHWFRADARGRDALRSPFAEEAIRALGRSPTDVPVAAIPPREACRSAADLLARAALDAFAEPAFRVTPPPPPPQAIALLSELRGGPLAPRIARIARAALAERERVRVFVRERPPGRFSGQLSGAALDAVLPLFRFGPDRPLSAGMLEDHAVCAFRTLGKRVLHLAPEEEPDEELSPLERGQLLHKCLERFFVRLGSARGLSGSAADFELLRVAVDETLEDWAREHHVGHPGLWELRKTDVHRTLAAVVDAESEHGPRPLAIEARFGFEGGWDPLRLRDGDDEVCVRGAIDRVDRTPDGVLVLDYKSSRPDTLKLKLRALLDTEFQLPLYAAVLRQRGEAHVDASYVSLGVAKRSDRLSKFAGGSLDALLELDPARRAALRAQVPPPPNLADKVFEKVREMRAGTFEVRPTSCEFCELRPACRLVALPTDPDENAGEQSRA